jgi:hypothetical protein
LRAELIEQHVAVTPPTANFAARSRIHDDRCRQDVLVVEMEQFLIEVFRRLS